MLHDKQELTLADLDAVVGGTNSGSGGNTLGTVIKTVLLNVLYNGNCTAADNKVTCSNPVPSGYGVIQ
jgi:hypothetical protein